MGGGTWGVGTMGAGGGRGCGGGAAVWLPCWLCAAGGLVTRLSLPLLFLGLPLARFSNFPLLFPASACTVRTAEGEQSPFKKMLTLRRRHCLQGRCGGQPRRGQPLPALPPHSHVAWACCPLVVCQGKGRFPPWRGCATCCTWRTVPCRGFACAPHLVLGRSWTPRLQRC